MGNTTKIEGKPVLFTFYLARQQKDKVDEISFFRSEELNRIYSTGEVIREAIDYFLKHRIVTEEEKKHMKEIFEMMKNLKN